jgi:hypothetical protein
MSREATVFEAFAAACRDQLGLDPETVLRAHLGELDAGMLGLDQLEETKPDKGMLPECARCSRASGASGSNGAPICRCRPWVRQCFALRPSVPAAAGARPLAARRT